MPPSTGCRTRCSTIAGATHQVSTPSSEISPARPISRNGPGAGGEPGVDVGVDGADVGNGEEECRDTPSRRTALCARPRRWRIAAARWSRRR